MVRKYDVIGRRVRSAPKPIVARTAPAVERPPRKIYVRVAREAYGNCISNCVSGQRECHDDALKVYRAASRECGDTRKKCIESCKPTTVHIGEE